MSCPRLVSAGVVCQGDVVYKEGQRAKAGAESTASFFGEPKEARLIFAENVR